MLSKKGKYALRALIYLAQQRGRGPVLIKEVSEREKIPKKFLEAILLQLKNEGVLQSRKGKGGGYYLERSPDTITLGQIVRITDGPLAIVPCVSRTAYAPCLDCPNEVLCRIRPIMKDVRDAVSSVLDNTTLDHVIKRGPWGDVIYEPMSYDI